MAGRSPKIGLPYFMHDTDVSSDPKFEFIEATHGIIGYAVTMKIYERIYRDGYFTHWPDRDVPIFAKKIGVDAATVRTIVGDAVTEGIFDAEMLEKHSILTSHGIQKRFIHATSKRVASVIDPLYDLLKPVPNIAKPISAPEMPNSAEEIPISAPEMPNSAEEMQQVSKGSKERKGKEAEEAEYTAPLPPDEINPLVIPEDQFSARDGTSLKAYFLHSWGSEARRMGCDIFNRYIALGVKHGWPEVYRAIDEAAKYGKMNFAYVEAIVDPAKRQGNQARKEKSWEENFINGTS